MNLVKPRTLYLFTLLSISLLWSCYSPDNFNIDPYPYPTIEAPVYAFIPTETFNVAKKNGYLIQSKSIKMIDSMALAGHLSGKYVKLSDSIKLILSESPSVLAEKIRSLSLKESVPAYIQSQIDKVIMDKMMAGFMASMVFPTVADSTISAARLGMLDDPQPISLSITECNSIASKLYSDYTKQLLTTKLANEKRVNELFVSRQEVIEKGKNTCQATAEAAHNQRITTLKDEFGYSLTKLNGSQLLEADRDALIILRYAYLVDILRKSTLLQKAESAACLTYKNQQLYTNITVKEADLIKNQGVYVSLFNKLTEEYKKSVVSCEIPIWKE